MSIYDICDLSEIIVYLDKDCLLIFRSLSKNTYKMINDYVNKLEDIFIEKHNMLKLHNKYKFVSPIDIYSSLKEIKNDNFILACKGKWKHPKIRYEISYGPIITIDIHNTVIITDLYSKYNTYIKNKKQLHDVLCNFYAYLCKIGIISTIPPIHLQLVSSLALICSGNRVAGSIQKTVKFKHIKYDSFPTSNYMHVYYTDFLSFYFTHDKVI